MAFALTSFFADGVKYQGPGPYRATQCYTFTCTGLTTDVDFDLGDYSGTFWTAAIADATYGTMATQVLQYLQDQDSNFLVNQRFYTPQLAGRVVAAAASGTAYTVSLNSTSLLPEYTFAASNGATAYTVFVELQLKPNYLPSNIAFNVQV